MVGESRLAAIPAQTGRPLALVKGAGDLASGVAVHLVRAGFRVVMTETAHPTAVRRAVAFAEAVYEGRMTVEGIQGILCRGEDEVHRRLAEPGIPVLVLVDPRAQVLAALQPELVVDAIMAKRNLGTRMEDAPAVIALGPGFIAGKDAHAVIETKRGVTLGRVITQGGALPDTGVPGERCGFTNERVLRSPGRGIFFSSRQIGDRIKRGQVVGRVNDLPVESAIAGVLRGILRSGLSVCPGFKLGDVDPAGDRRLCFRLSDKACAVGGAAGRAACSLLGVRMPSGAWGDEAARREAAMDGATIVFHGLRQSI
ncbi:MAG: selenium-dependent molybdenum cofactor biosynthesis protein YqeB [Actinobacteria bacterium]|nr:selenium-dependent molybdenum cofactor biosynthesis protein YqeB [Actinomycetota bacterium]